MSTKITSQVSLAVLSLQALQAHAQESNVSGNKSKKPNIIIIYTDDQGYGDLGCYGAKGFKTPHIDKLAKNGIRFSHFYAPQAVSSASRAGLLTGCYPNRIGISGALMPREKRGLGKGEITIAELLKTQGYATAMFGKWHLGSNLNQLPIEHGFDTWFGIPYSIDMIPMNYDGTAPGPEQKKRNYPLLPVYHDTTVISRLSTQEGIDTLGLFLTKACIAFIENQSKEKPFFIYFPTPMPHTPLGISNAFKNKSKQGPYGDVIQEIDAEVGEIIQTLKKKGLLENTLIIYSSDNGPWLNFGAWAGSSGGLREGKGTTWEGGQRVPFIAYWKNHIPKGSESHEIASAIDLFPTIAAITHSELPEHPIDGVSLQSVLMGDTTAHPRTIFYYYYENNQLQAIRWGPWKRIYPHTSRSYVNVPKGEHGNPGPYASVDVTNELYHLIQDPEEKNNLFASYPEVVNQIDSIAAKARLELGDALVKVKGNANRPADGMVRPLQKPTMHLAYHANIRYLKPYSEQYEANKDSSMTDGLFGTSDFSDGNWQGFSGNDLDLIIDLNVEKDIHTIRCAFYDNPDAWIFLPRSVSITYSLDGKTYYPYADWTRETLQAGAMEPRKTASKQQAIRARYIHVHAVNQGICPVGHVGEGKPAWLFADEIEIE